MSNKTNGDENKKESFKNKDLVLKSKYLKYGIISIVILLGFFAFSRIIRPILLSLAHYIIKLEKTGNDDYQAREISVEIEEVKSISMPKYINTIGELKANQSVVLHSEINGRIKEIVFKEGTTVSKNDILIKFDDEQAQAELKLHKAKLQQTEVEYDRQKKMKESGAASGKDYDKALAELNMARAEVEVKEANLHKCEIRAPFEGTIGLIDVGAGSFVQPNQELVTLVDQTPIRVKFGVSGKNVNDVGAGQTIELRVESSKGKVFKGTVEAVDSRVDSSTNNITLIATIPNEEGALKPGLFADVMLIIGEQGDTITVDEAAIERVGEQEYVWVVDQKKARRVGILTGARNKGRIEVIAGLKSGQTVVIAGQLRLFEGAWVKFMNKSDAGEAAIDNMIEEVM
ncbi:MAG: efflux RND transporter periplasmic adaptor subunit [Holosporales bacterium]|jgi:membrane fusion protein (multidrug efflux system)|nr:efflux RND transporter periplasmic adaptor subunit [Holosporales bacterium]